MLDRVCRHYNNLSYLLCKANRKCFNTALRWLETRKHLIYWGDGGFDETITNELPLLSREMWLINNRPTHSLMLTLSWRLLNIFWNILHCFHRKIACMLDTTFIFYRCGVKYEDDWIKFLKWKILLIETWATLYESLYLNARCNVIRRYFVIMYIYYLYQF